MREMVDYVPQIVAFNVDYFSTLFVSVCMLDVVFMLMEFRDLRSDANHLYNLLRDHKNCSSSHAFRQGSDDLLEVVRDPTLASHAHSAKSLPNVCLWACEPRSLPSERLDALMTLESLDVYCSRSHHLHAIIPNSRISVKPAGPVASVVEKASDNITRADGPPTDQQKSVSVIDSEHQFLRHGRNVVLGYPLRKPLIPLKFLAVTIKSSRLHELSLTPLLIAPPTRTSA
ncbi:hypothetical protein JG687_00012347 [Phytophthora cactorum]|uniref:Uncharacterized protein n=1 Tax=Phytophthora cactorum TaxID=29920 RepID=A0A8T1U5V2_9STRA|nr:hypothetical protein JG687_00012347 [Phytophthora cactorum]